MSSQRQPLPHSVVEFVAGFIAGVTSTCVSHPLDIVKTRLQLQGSALHGRRLPKLTPVQSQVGQSASTPFYGNSIRIIRNIARDEGALQGFYRGLTPNIVGNSVSWAVYFVLYDRIKHGINTHEGPGTSLSYYDYFLASGIAGKIYKLLPNCEDIEYVKGP